MSRLAVQPDADLDAAAHELLARYAAEARIGVARLLVDLDDAARVDDVEGYVVHVFAAVAARS